MIEQVNKGGITWAELSIGKNPRGLVISIRAVPQIEEFCSKALGDGTRDNIEIYGRDWIPVGDSVMQIYRMTKEITPLGVYSITRPAESIRGSKDNRINISFLRTVGISDPQGIKFIVCGPYSNVFAREITTEIAKAIKTFVMEYIVPVQINIRISSQEV